MTQHAAYVVYGCLLKSVVKELIAPATVLRYDEATGMPYKKKVTTIKPILGERVFDSYEALKAALSEEPGGFGAPVTWLAPSDDCGTVDVVLGISVSSIYDTGVRQLSLISPTLWGEKSELFLARRQLLEWGAVEFDLRYFLMMSKIE